MSTEKIFIVVDGSSYLFRAYHALPSLTSSKGEPTGAIFGVLNMLNKLLDEYDPQKIAIVFDTPGKTFRDDIYNKYKANRPPMPDDLRPQIEPLFRAIKALGLPLLKVKGVEADDVIGTLASIAEKNNIQTIISTSDKDMAQLVNENVSLVDTMSNKTYDTKGVINKFGVKPSQIIDYLALVGDTADNIPGVPSVGPKTASKWLKQYNNLDRIIEKSDEIEGKVGEKLRESLDKLPLYKKLTTIVRDVEINIEFNDLHKSSPNKEELKKLHERFEINSLLRGLKETKKEAIKNNKTSYKSILDKNDLIKELKKVEKSKIVSIDTETTSLDYMSAKLVGISMSHTPNEAFYIPLSHDYPSAQEQLDKNYVLKKLKPWLESNNKKVGQNIKYDMHIFENYNIKMGGVFFDSMMESFVLNSTASRHDIHSLAKKYLGYETVQYEEIAGKGAKQIGFNEVNIEEATKYAAENADITLKLHQQLWEKLEAIPKLKEIYARIERPIIKILQEMEHNGVLIDSNILNAQSALLARTIENLEKEIYKISGGSFNISSPKQLQEILYEKLELPILGKTPKGQPSTAENVLQDLAQDYELPRIILDYRALVKLKTTYTDKLPMQVNKITNRIHTSYHQAVAATGRLSSSNPNLQNIPIRKPEGRKIRQAFIAPEKHLLLAADYSQIELRIMAHLSKDGGLIKAFKNDEDIHKITASEVYNTDLKDITKEQRRSAKAINFGLIYGMSAFGLARQLGINRSEAQKYVDLYFEKYPKVKEYMDETKSFARENGFVSTIHGRRLYLPEINSKNHQRKMYAERSAINAPMQGSAADIIKLAMISVDEWLKKSFSDAKIIMQVHDELVLEANKNQIDEIAEKVKMLMEGATKISVPLKVEYGIGNNWDEAH
jgi:DNA polymerase-1